MEDLLDFSSMLGPARTDGYTLRNKVHQLFRSFFLKTVGAPSSVQDFLLLFVCQVYSSLTETIHCNEVEGLYLSTPIFMWDKVTNPVKPRSKTLGFRVFSPNYLM